MKKLSILSAILVLCAVSWVGSTYVVGGQVENQYQRLLKQYSQYGPFTLSSQEYQRGVLSSTARTVLELRVPKTPSRRASQVGQEGSGKSVQLVFEHRLSHGPWPLAQGSDGQTLWAPALARGETRLVGISPGREKYEKLLTEIPQLADALAFFSIALNGDIGSQIRIPAFEHGLDGDQISWGGFVLDADFAADFKTLVGSFEMPKMDIRMENGEVSWSGFRGQFDLEETLPLLYIGSSELLFGAMDIKLSDAKSGEQNNVQMKGFEVSVASQYDGKLVRYDQSMQLAGVTVDGETFGPGVCEVALSNLDGAMLSNFQGQVQEVYLNGNSFSPDELVAQVLPLYSRLFEKLIEGTPEVHIKRLSFATPLGDVDGRLRVKFSGKQGLTTDNPSALLKYLEADAELSIDEGLISAVLADSLKSKLKAAREQGQIPPFSDEELVRMAERQFASQVDALLAQNLIVRDGGTLKSSAIYNRGELVLNGKPLPLFRGK